MANVAVVFHSGYGHTKVQAQAVIDGVNAVDGAEALAFEISSEGDIGEAQWEQLNNADAIVFGSPTYMGMVSWQFKKFADSSSKPWFSQNWKNKVAAGFTNSASINGDKHSTLHYMVTLAMQHSMVWVGTGMLPSNSKAADRNDLNYLGSFAGLMAQSPSDASPEEGPLPGDLDTAIEFGKRIAEVTLQWGDK